MKIIGILTLVLVSITSCTITKQRYSGGFHIEWKRRLTTVHSVKSSPPLVADTKEILSDDPKITEITLVKDLDRQLTKPIQHVETLSEYPQFQDSISIANDPVTSRTNEFMVNEYTLNSIKGTGKEKMITRKSDQRKSKEMTRGNFWETVSNFLFGLVFVLLFLATPPLLHTILIAMFSGYNWKVILLILLEWLLWVGFIVAVLPLLSGFWPIFLAFIGFNFLLSSVGTLIILNNYITD